MMKKELFFHENTRAQIYNSEAHMDSAIANSEQTPLNLSQATVVKQPVTTSHLQETFQNNSRFSLPQSFQAFDSTKRRDSLENQSVNNLQLSPESTVKIPAR